MKLSLWLGALFVISVALFTRENGFPFFYHPDEPGKVRQVIVGDWNFHHPMLMLNASRIASGMVNAKTEQQTVIIGRWISALFTSVAIVALSLLAFQWRGMFGAISAGLLLLLHHQLFELAHYMKEDTALLMGLALVLLAATYFWKKPSVIAASGAGLACGLAISGKYLGIVSLVLILPVLWIAPKPSRRSVHFTIFFAALLIAFAAINWPMLLELGRSQENLNREVNLVVGGQGGMTRSVPHAQYWNVFVDNTTPAIWLLLLIYLVGFWKTRRERSLPEWLVTIFPFALAILLSCSPKTNDRYFLPATAIFTLLAALGIADAGKLIPRHQRVLPYALLVIAIVAQLPSLVKYFRAFQIDDRRELHAWIESNLPARSVIATDTRVRLVDAIEAGDPIGAQITAQKIELKKLGSLDELITQGANYAIVSQSDYGRYFLSGQKPQEGYEEDFQRRKKFYEDLFERGTWRWERPRGTVIYLHPGLKVYELPVAGR